MSYPTSLQTHETGPFSEFLERPGCYTFAIDRLDASPPVLQSQEGLVGAIGVNLTVNLNNVKTHPNSGNTGYYGTRSDIFIPAGGISAEASEALESIREEFVSSLLGVPFDDDLDMFKSSSLQEAAAHGIRADQRLIGGLAAYNAGGGEYRAGVFVSRKFLPDLRLIARRQEAIVNQYSSVGPRYRPGNYDQLRRVDRQLHARDNLLFPLALNGLMHRILAEGLPTCPQFTEHTGAVYVEQKVTLAV